MKKSYITIILVTLLFTSCRTLDFRYIEDYRDSFYIARKQDATLFSSKYLLYSIDEKGEKDFIIKTTQNDYPSIISAYYDEDWHAYYYEGHTIIFRKKNSEKYQYIKINSKQDFNQYPFIYPLLRDVISDASFSDFSILSRVLIKAGDKYSIKKIKQYANGEFSLDQIKHLKKYGQESVILTANNALKYSLP